MKPKKHPQQMLLIDPYTETVILMPFLYCSHELNRLVEGGAGYSQEAGKDLLLWTTLQPIHVVNREALFPPVFSLFIGEVEQLCYGRTLLASKGIAALWTPLREKYCHDWQRFEGQSYQPHICIDFHGFLTSSVIDMDALDNDQPF